MRGSALSQVYIQTNYHSLISVGWMARVFGSLQTHTPTLTPHFIRDTVTLTIEWLKL
jgi:hypothetical protein